MNTPICDFVEKYAGEETLRLHMPGHKGMGGIERLDITEIDGADSLYEASPERGGIIAQSEANASALFGCPTFYSTEGSSQCIRAMLCLALTRTGNNLILAARNVHRTFVSAAALLDLEVEWLCGGGSYLSCTPSADELEEKLKSMPKKPAALYLTSPDYLGDTSDISALAEVCHKYDLLLLCDCAHGAYLRFLPESRHPADLGADLCCSSAHKTLPVLTGGAYLHVPSDEPYFADAAKSTLALFGSTSPSYLILQSLDAANRYLAEGYKARLADFCRKVGALKRTLAEGGYTLIGSEPLKLTVAAKEYGYTGTEYAALLAEGGMVCEFADGDHLVMMLTPELGDNTLSQIGTAMLSIPKKAAVDIRPPSLHLPERAISIRRAVLSRWEELPVAECVGRVLATAEVGCPPAVMPVVCGEIIDAEAAEVLAYYGIEKCRVVIGN